MHPLCVIVVKSGAEGGKLIFKFPFLENSEEGFEEEVTRNNPYAFRIAEDPLNDRVHAEPTNIKDDCLVGFSDEILANMFSVPKELCGSKFELKVNDVRFVGHPISLEPSMGEGGQWKSPLTMIHIVFALKACSDYSIVTCYHELSHRIGMLLKHEERRVGYLDEQTRCLMAAQDEFSNLPEDQQDHPFSMALERSSLARDIRTVYECLCYNGEVRLYINKWVELSFCLPQKMHQVHFPELMVDQATIFTCLESLRPYHTLLFLESENDLMESLSTDASPALRRLIRLSSPLKSFRTLSVETDLSAMQVFQLAGHLFYWGKATAIYPICESNVYVVSSHLPCPLPLHLQTKFEDKFPGENLLEKLSTFSLPCRLQLSPPFSLSQPKMTEIIIWLLRNHLIVQLHTYVTLALTPDMSWNLREPKTEDVGAMSQSVNGISIHAKNELLPSEASITMHASFKEPVKTPVENDDKPEADRSYRESPPVANLTPIMSSMAASKHHSSNNQQQGSEGIQNHEVEVAQLMENGAERRKASLTVDSQSTVNSLASLNQASMSSSLMGLSQVESVTSGLGSDGGSMMSLTSDKAPAVSDGKLDPKSNTQKVDGNESGEAVAREPTAQELEERRKQALLQFTPAEIETLSKVSAFSNLEDLEKFVHLSKYFRGNHHIEEIMYHENLRRSSLLHIIDKFRDVLIKEEREDPAISRYFKSLKVVP